MSRIATVFVVLLCTLYPAAGVFASEANRAVVSPLATLGKLAIALTVVLTLFWVFARVTRHLQSGQGSISGNLKIIAALSLGQRERVVVVQVGDEQLVLGVTASQINALHVLDKPLTSGSTEGIGDFKQKLKSALNRQVTNR